MEVAANGIFSHIVPTGNIAWSVARDGEGETGFGNQPKQSAEAGTAATVGAAGVVLAMVVMTGSLVGAAFLGNEPQPRQTLRSSAHRPGVTPGTSTWTISKAALRS